MIKSVSQSTIFVLSILIAFGSLSSVGAHAIGATIPNISVGSFSVRENIHLSVAVGTELDLRIFAPYGQVEIKSSNPKLIFEFAPKILPVVEKNAPAVDRRYLANSSYFDFKSDVFKDFFSKLDQNESLNLKLVKITQFIRNELGLGFGSLPSSKLLKASDIFVQRKTECHQISALYVTLARGLEIPSRIIYGVQFEPLERTQNLTSLHAWVEVWDGMRWRPLEPFNEDLGLDFGFVYLPVEEDFLYSQQKNKQVFLEKVAESMVILQKTP